MMKNRIYISLAGILLFASSTYLSAGILNPDCTAKKALKSAELKAVTGVKGRCSASEAAKDTLGIDDKRHKKNKKHKKDE